MSERLTDLVTEYQRSGTDREQLMAAIAQRIYRLPKYIAGCDEDVCSDFFLFFYPKIPGMILRYRDQGSSFESYLFTACRYQLKGYLGRRRSRNRKERIGDSAAFWMTAEPCIPFPDAVQDDERLPEPLRSLAPAHRTVGRTGAAGPAAVPTPRGPAAAVGAASLPRKKRAETRRDAMRRRILMFAMRDVMNLQEKDLLRLSELTGFDAEWLGNCADRLREILFARSRRVERLRERRNGIFFRIHLLQDELSGETDLMRREELRVKLEDSTIRLRDLQQDIARAQRHPSHAELAAVLGFPKGSVDSGLYYLRRYARALYPERRFVYAQMHENSPGIRQCAQTAGNRRGPGRT